MHLSLGEWANCILSTTVPCSKIASAPAAMMFSKMALRLLIVFSAFGAAYFVLTLIWDVPEAESVLGIIIIINLVLGILLYRRRIRFDGTIDVIEKDEGGKLYSLNLDGDPEEIDKKDEVLFKVSKP